jgi:serine/threonine protein kinase
VARRDYYVGPEVDCWALGVLLYAMVTGEFPFFSRDPLQLARRIMNAEYTTPDIISPVCADLISRLLVVDVSKRLNIDQVMEHPFVRDEKPTLVRGRSRSHEMLPKLPPQAGADAQVPGATSAVSQVRSQHAPTSASTKSRGGALGFVQKFLSRKVRKTEQSAMKFAEQEQPLTSSLQAVPRSSSGKSSSKKR